MNSCDLVLAVSALAVSMAKQMDDDELALSAAFFTQLGDTLQTISTTRDVCNNK